MRTIYLVVSILIIVVLAPLLWGLGSFYSERGDIYESALSNIAAEEPMLVALLDTGLDADHEVLEGRVVAEANFGTSPTADDLLGHGTHMAGIIVMDSDCLLLNVKVTDDRGKCNAAAIADGIMWAVKNNADIINISLYLIDPSELLGEAMVYASESGVIIVASAGNIGTNLPVYPAYYEECIAVGAIMADGSRVPMTNYGSWIDTTALGYEVYSALPDNEYGYKTGTSPATAYITRTLCVGN